MKKIILLILILIGYQINFGASLRINRVIPPLPPTAAISGTASVCQNASQPNITFTGSSGTAPYTFTYKINGGSNLTVSTTGSSNTVTVAAPTSTSGTFVYSLVSVSDATPSTQAQSGTATITVNPLPTASISGTTTVCQNTSSPNITFTGSIGTSPFTFTYKINGGTSLSVTTTSGNSVTISVPTNTAGTFVYSLVSVSDANSCSQSQSGTATVTVNPTPVLSNSTTMSLCSGTNVNISLTASPASTFSWTMGTNTGSISGATSGSGSTISQTLTNPSNSTSGSVVYVVTPTSSLGCVGSSTSITVTVNPIPVLTNSTTVSTCSGISPAINLTASTACNFSWTLGTNIGSISGATSSSGSTINQTPTNPSNSTAGSIVYIVTPVSTQGCGGNATSITVTVNPIPVITSSTTATICSGASPNIGLTATASSNFSWTLGTNIGSISGATSSSGSTINQTLTNPSNLTTGSLVYITIPTSTVGCIGSAASITVTVNPAPKVTNSTTLGICSGSSINISLTSSISGTFSWNIGTNTGSIAGATSGSGSTINQTLTNPSNSAAGSIIYNVTPTSSLGCVGSTTSITVTVNPIPVVTNSTTATTCSGISPNISLTASAASNFSWTTGTNIGSVSGATSSSGSAINQTLTNPSNLTAGSIVYIVTPTSTQGCAGSAVSITVTVNPAPSLTNSTAKTICSGDNTNINLTASISSTFSWTVVSIFGGISGANGSSGSTLSQVLSNPVNNGSGNVVYGVTPTSSAGCAGNPVSITVTVNPLPTLTSSTTKTICSGDNANINLTASVSSSFSWTIVAGSGSISGASANSGSTISQTLSNSSSSTSGSIIYVVTPVSATGCVGSPTSITVTVNPIPVVTTSTTKTICSGDNTNITLTASASSSFSWTIGGFTGSITGYSSNSGSSISQVLTNTSSSAAATVTYVVTPIASGCVGNPTSITVTVNPIPVVTTSTTKTICSGDNTNISLTASSSSSFNWTAVAGSGSISGSSTSSGSTINQTLNNTSNSNAGSVIYIVTPTAAGCVGSPTSITVTVNPIPVITTSTSKTICSGDNTNITLTATASSSFTWTLGTPTGTITGSIPNSGSAITQTLNNTSNSSPGTVVYIVTPTAAGCVGSPTSITVTVNPIPVLTTSTTKTICSGENVNITLTATASSSYIWIMGTPTGNISGSGSSLGSSIGQTLTNQSNATAGSVVYIVTPTAAGCVGSPTSITVTVNPLPEITTSTFFSICSGATTKINLSATASSSFTWVIGSNTGFIKGATLGNGSSINHNLINPSDTLPGSITYIVTPISTNGCKGSSSTITVVINPLPTLTTSNKFSICSGSKSNVGLIATNISSFKWVLGPNTGNISGASSDSGSIINQTLTNPSNSASGSIEYIITPTSTAGCVGKSTSVIVSVFPLPEITTLKTSTICSGEKTNIVLTSSILSSYTWTMGTNIGNISGGQGSTGSIIGQALSNPSNANSGSLEYIVTPISNLGCIGKPTTILVTVNALPEILTYTKKTICSEENTNIGLTSSISGIFNWNMGLNTGGITGSSPGSGSIISQMLINPLDYDSGSVVYIVTPTSSLGCVGKPSSITVIVNPLPVVKTALTKVICSGFNTNIDLLASVSSNFSWKLGANSGNLIGATDGSGNRINQILSNSTNNKQGSIIYNITTISSKGCTGKTTAILVKVNPKPKSPVIQIPPIIKDNKLCKLTSNMNFETDSASHQSYKWYISGDSAIIRRGSQRNNAIIFFNLEGKIKIWCVTKIDSTGCSDSSSVDIKVNPNSTNLCSDIIAKPNKNGLVCLRNDIKSYNWGYDSLSNNQMAADSLGFLQYYDFNLKLTDTRRYWVIVTSKDGCYSKTYFRDDCKVPINSVQKIGASNFTLAPNPVITECTIKFNQDMQGQFELIIFDVNGKELIRQVDFINSSRDYNMDLSHLNKGLYFVQVSVGGQLQNPVKILKL